MDKTNRAIKICRKLEEIDFSLSLRRGISRDHKEALTKEQKELEAELDNLDVASAP